MDILPAIDLRGGKVVRLEQGDYGQSTQYSDDPGAVAATFAAAGATWIHVVDLDAALIGKLTNVAALRAIRAAAPAGVKIEFGGGIRNDDAASAIFAEGVDRAVVGSAALKDWAWFERLVSRKELAGKIALGLDARGGKLAVHGWTQTSDVLAVDVARRVRGWPLGAIVYTDIARDGMLQGVNIAATQEIVQATDVGVVASGGVSTLEDVTTCRQIGCSGAIIGKAWYEGRIDLAQAIVAAR